MWARWHGGGSCKMCVPEDYLRSSLLFLVFDAANVASENAGALESDIESDIEMCVNAELQNYARE